MFFGDKLETEFKFMAFVAGFLATFLSKGWTGFRLLDFDLRKPFWKSKGSQPHIVHSQIFLVAPSHPLGFLAF